VAESAEGPVGPDDDGRMGDRLEENFAQAREDVCQFVEFDLFSSQSPPRETFVVPNFYLTDVGARANWGWERTSLRIAEQ